MTTEEKLRIAVGTLKEIEFQLRVLYRDHLEHTKNTIALVVDEVHKALLSIGEAE